MSQRGPKIPPVILTKEERDQLERWSRSQKSERRLVFRSLIILRCADGQPSTRVAEELGTSALTVRKWRTRFLRDRLEALSDAPRTGKPRTISDGKIEDVVRLTLEETPKGGGRWSTRQMAKRVGINRTRVSEIWRAFGLKPHLPPETFILSPDPDFVDKVRDVVGLYMNPPDRAVVLCLDEKSQIQALNRLQPVLPLRPGQRQNWTPEYQRNGTTTLFAALDRATGRVIGKCMPRHRAEDLLKFLRLIDRDVERDLNVHVVLDNYGTHKSQAVRDWLARHPRFVFHYTPTYASWMNLVESVFANLQNQVLQGAVHCSVKELQEDIERFLAANNEQPKPYTWTRTADEILASVAKRCMGVLEQFAAKKSDTD